MTTPDPTSAAGLREWLDAALGVAEYEDGLDTAEQITNIVLPVFAAWLRANAQAIDATPPSMGGEPILFGRRIGWTDAADAIDAEVGR